MADGVPEGSRIARGVAVGKDVVALLRDFSIVVLFGLLMLAPPFVRSRLEGAGFVEGEIMGLKWKTRAKELGDTSRDLEQTLVEAQRQLERQAGTIEANQALIAALSKRLGDSPAVEAVASDSSRVLAATRAVDASVAGALQRAAPTVEKARQAAGDARWAVVFGGDPTREAAQYEADLARRRGLPPVQLFLRHGWYRTVAPTADRATSQKVLELARRRRASAYVVDLTAWCPSARREGDLVVCK